MPTVMQRLFGAAGLAGGLSLPRLRPFKEMGGGGVSVWGGYIRSIERNVNWSGQQRYITTSEIVANVSIVAASVHYFMNVISRPAWSVVPADDTPKAAEFADFVEEVLYDMDTPWPRIVRRATSYRFHGYSIQEWTAKKLESTRHRGKGSKHRAGGGIGIQDIEPRPQHTIEQWVVDEHGEVEGVWQRSPQTGALLGLPRSKLIYLVDDSLSDSPEGLGAFRHLAEPYSRLKQFLALEARAFERDLRGTPIGRAPITLINEAVSAGNLTRTEGDVMIRGMQDFIEQQVKQADTGMLLDSMPYESDVIAGRQMTATPQWSMELLQGSANGLQELHTAIDRIQREMARIFGTEHLMLGESAGSRALSQDKSRNLYLSANAVLSNIVEAMTQDLIDPLWNLNGFPEELKPWFKAEDVAPKEVTEITAALREMATAGAVLAPDDEIIDDIRDLLGVSRQPEREEEEMDAMVRTALGIKTPEEEAAELAAMQGMSGQVSDEFPLNDERGDQVLEEVEKFDPNQPREPVGSPEGGRWTRRLGGGRGVGVQLFQADLADAQAAGYKVVEHHKNEASPLREFAVLVHPHGRPALPTGEGSFFPASGSAITVSRYSDGSVNYRVTYPGRLWAEGPMESRTLKDIFAAIKHADELHEEYSKAFDESKHKRTPRGKGGGQFTTKPKVGVKPGEEKIPKEFLIRVEIEPDVWITLDKRKLGGKSPREAAIEQAIKDGIIEKPKEEEDEKAEDVQPQPEHTVTHEEGDATKLLAENWDDTTEEELMASLSQEERDKIAWAEAESAAYPSTSNLVSEGGFKNPDGTWTEERAALHADILDKFFNAQAVAAATPAFGQSPEFVFTGGRPAAGKTSALAAGNIALDKSKYLTISADDFQTYLPGYQGHLAGRFNPEGQYLAEQAEMIARTKRLNTIYDATMKSTAPAVKRVQELKADDWVVKVYFTHTTPVTAARRSVSRFMAEGGRYVPPSISMKSLTNEQTFDAVRPHLDEWALFDNNGAAPKLVASGGSRS